MPFSMALILLRETSGPLGQVLLSQPRGFSEGLEIVEQFFVMFTHGAIV